MNKTFQDCKIHEVYADVDYTLGMDNPSLVILTLKMEYSVTLYNAIYRVYPQIKSCSVTSNPRHPALAGKKIIYRDGAWYV